MQSQDDEAQIRGRILVWWMIWFSLITGLCIIYYFLAQPITSDAQATATVFDFIGLVPLFASVAIRWFVLPRCTNMQIAFVAFIAGISLAEGCGILAIFLGAAYRDEIFALGVLGIAQFVPFYAKRFAVMRTA
jgi:hypothetical protein